MQLIGVIAVDATFRLVADQEHRPPTATQGLSDLLVERGEPVSDVNHEHADVGLGNGHSCVLLCRAGQCGDIRRGVLRQRDIEPGSVDQREPLAAPLHHAVETIARESRIHRRLRVACRSGD